MTAAADGEYRAELTTFNCKECYVYRPPPASSIGHRAEFWDVDHWLQEVSLKIITCDEDCTIRMFDIKTGALFAECPIPKDAPLTTVVEPVVDSSRYFALRIEDPISKRHAFIGIGFRERTEASDFNAALYEHTQYLRRKKEALEMREAYESNADSAGNVASSSSSDFSFKPGETITLKLGKSKLSTPPLGLTRLSASSATMPQSQNTAGSTDQIPLLAPPPGNSLSPLPDQQPGISGVSDTPQDDLTMSSAAASSQTFQAIPTQHPPSLQTGYATAHRQAQEFETEGSLQSAEAEAQQSLHDKLPLADDWGEFVS